MEVSSNNLNLVILYQKYNQISNVIKLMQIFTFISVSTCLPAENMSEVPVHTMGCMGEYWYASIHS
jgi:hypothetical protein